VAGPGVLGDQAAVKQCGLSKLIEDLPGLLCVIGDCAYLPTEHMVPIFGGIQAKTTVNDDFNYYASQCRIRIEMAFGLMVQKWRILERPISVKLIKLHELVVCIAHLHNFCINERQLRLQTGTTAVRPEDVEFSLFEQMMRETSATNQFEEAELLYANPNSANRARMVDVVLAKKMYRPKKSAGKSNRNTI
jgi:DDE superfamily endonuclease